MKILYFTRGYTPHDFRFLSAVADGGHEAYFLRLNPHQSSESRSLPVGVEAVSGALKDVIAGVEPDLLHAGPLQDCGYLAAKSGFHPLVQMSWGSDVLWEAKQNADARRRIRFALQYADAVIGDCKVVKKAVKEFGVPSERVVIFPWGIDLRRFSPKGKGGGLRKRLGWQKNLVLLHLRAWEPLYDPLTVVLAFLRAARQNPKLRLLMPGEGSLNPKIQSAFQKAGLEDYVYLPGNVMYEKLPDYFHASDIYVSASLSDGSSVSLMEALASGVPAAVSDIPSNREWVRPGKQGWLFPTGDEQALSDLILKAAHSNRLKSMANICRQTAQRRANWKDNGPLLFKAYEKALVNAS